MNWLFKRKKIPRYKGHTILLAVDKFFLKLNVLARKILGLPKRRNVIFLNNSYYHFYYLARELRALGWDAITVSLEPPDGSNSMFYHGEDINVYSPDPDVFRQNVESLYKMALDRYDLMHFAGDGTLSFFHPFSHDYNNPEDIIEWKKRGKKIAYTVSGCNSATAQSSVKKWSMSNALYSVCSKCVWELRPDVCSDQKNLAWGSIVQKYTDLICAEMIPALDYIANTKTVFEPLSACLDKNFWNPNLVIPQSKILERKLGTTYVYHSVGNYDSRSSTDRNIKGTGAVIDAISRLKSEGYQIELRFVTNMPNAEVRYVQAQSDIIVDQLNYGRYGANAREGMMLGKPVICYINSAELNDGYENKALKECPLISAKEENVYFAIKNLIDNPGEIVRIGSESRAYALKWHDAQACARRYKQVYDKLFAEN